MERRVYAIYRPPQPESFPGLFLSGRGVWTVFLDSGLFPSREAATAAAKPWRKDFPELYVREFLLTEQTQTEQA